MDEHVIPFQQTLAELIGAPRNVAAIEREVDGLIDRLREDAFAHRYQRARLALEAASSSLMLARWILEDCPVQPVQPAAPRKSA